MDTSSLVEGKTGLLQLWSRNYETRSLTMESESILTSILALFVLLSGMGITLWTYYSALFYRQWLTPANKAIVITGCDSGIGWQLAKYFHQKGSFVIATVVSSQSAGAIKLQNELKSDRFHMLQLNLKNKAEIVQTVENIKNILSQSKLGIHALVNNAGICVFGEFDFCTIEQIEDQVNINILGTFSLTKLLLPQLIKSKGRIVNTSSVNAMISFPGISVYSATKSAIEAFSDALRMELYKFEVQVVNVRLGDYAKLTDIMTKHQQVVVQQEKELSDFKKDLYGDYFQQYHQSALQNYGLFSPKSFQSSSLFSDFEEAILAVQPSKYILSATLSYKWLINFLAYLPATLRESLIRRFTNSMIQNDKQKN